MWRIFIENVSVNIFLCFVSIWNAVNVCLMCLKAQMVERKQLLAEKQTFSDSFTVKRSVSVLVFSSRPWLDALCWFCSFRLWFCCFLKPSCDEWRMGNMKVLVRFEGVAAELCVKDRKYEKSSVTVRPQTSWKPKLEISGPKRKVSRSGHRTPKNLLKQRRCGRTSTEPEPPDVCGLSSHRYTVVILFMIQIILIHFNIHIVFIYSRVKMISIPSKIPFISIHSLIQIISSHALVQIVSYCFRVQIISFFYI